MHKNNIERGMNCMILSSAPKHKGQMAEIVEVYNASNTVRLNVPGHGDQNVVGLESIVLWIDERWEPVQGVIAR